MGCKIFGGGGGGPSASADPGLQAQTDALNAQTKIQQEQFDYQKEQDARVLGIVQSNADIQNQAYADQLQLARDAFEQEKKDTQASMGLAHQQLDLATSSAAAAQANAAQSLELQVEQLNRVNQKAPDLASIVAQNQQQMRTGQGSTMLTGARGVDPNDLSLGRPTLLGAG